MHASRERIMSDKSPNFSKILTELKEEEVEFEQRERKEEGEITGSDDEDFSKILTELKEEEVEFEQRERKGGGEITGSDDEDFGCPSVFRFRPNRIDSSPAREEREEGEIISSSEDEDYDYPSVFRVEPNRIDSSIAAFHLDFRSSKRTKKMERMDNVDGNFQVNYSSVMKRSKEVQANLDPKFPSFFKLMLRFSQEFWLRIPSHFCKMHMPKHDETICLEDETGEKYETSYFAVTMELSSGWRGFCIRHNLLKGDVVVFHLVAFCKFKVYIVRAST